MTSAGCFHQEAPLRGSPEEGCGTAQARTLGCTRLEIALLRTLVILHEPFATVPFILHFLEPVFIFSACSASGDNESLSATYHYYSLSCLKILCSFEDLALLSCPVPGCI